MSDMMNYCAMRFKFRKDYEEPDKLLELLHAKGLYLNAKEMDDLYEKDGNYKVVWDYDDGMYLDRVFVDDYACDDMNFMLSGSDFIKYNNEVHDMFLDESALEDDCRLVCIEWYNGSDMPVDW